MTRKEFLGAYNLGYRDGKIEDYCPNDYDDIFDIEQEPHIDMESEDIKTLQKRAHLEGFHEAEKMLVKQELCDDAIARILKRMWNCRGKHTTSIDKVKMEQIIRDELPSVNPKADVLDKIKAEVEHIEVSGRIDEHSSFIRSGEHIKHMVIDIIDKYKADKENEE